MTLPTLPGDYAPDDTPTADELNAIKAHAGYHIDRLTTVLKRTGTVQLMTYNAFTAMQWNGVVNSRNGLGWTLVTPSRVPIPGGADGRYVVSVTAEFTAAAGGFRYSALAKNGTFIQPGNQAPSDATLTSYLASTWSVELVGGDYIEVLMFQNRTAATTLSINISGEAPQLSVWRVD